MCSTEACGGFVSLDTTYQKHNLYRGAFPPLLDIIAQNIPYRVVGTKLFVVPSHLPGETKG